MYVGRKSPHLWSLKTVEMSNITYQLPGVKHVIEVSDNDDRAAQIDKDIYNDS